MKKLFVFLCFSGLFLSTSNAREEITISMPRLRLGIEAGLETFFGQINKPEMIRESKYYYYYYDRYDDGFIYNSQDVKFSYIGIKPEYQLTKRIAVAAGIRFSYNKVVMKSDQDSFLWKLSEKGLTTNYVRIKEISQESYFIGVPLELRFFPKEKNYLWRNYFIFGMTFNYLISSTEDVKFLNRKMDKYTSEVLKHIDEPNNFQIYIYPGIGVKIGRENLMMGYLEFHFPACIYNYDSPNSLATVNNDRFGIGLQMSLLIPIFQNNQLTYTIK